MSHYDVLVRRGFRREGDCLITTGTRGYGQVKFQQENRAAHRVVYEVWHGPVPKDHVVDHECHNEAARAGSCDGGRDNCVHRRCVSPGHLIARTVMDNLLASPHTRPRRRGNSWQSNKKNCPQGHPYDEGNTAVYSGRRNCRTCIRVRRKKT